MQQVRSEVLPRNFNTAKYVQGLVNDLVAQGMSLGEIAEATGTAPVHLAVQAWRGAGTALRTGDTARAVLAERMKAAVR